MKSQGLKRLKKLHQEEIHLHASPAKFDHAKRNLETAFNRTSRGMVSVSSRIKGDSLQSHLLSPVMDSPLIELGPKRLKVRGPSFPNGAAELGFSSHRVPRSQDNNSWHHF